MRASLGHKSKNAQLPPTTVARVSRGHLAVFRGLSWHKPALMAVLAATFFLYAPVLRYQFVYDDNAQILNNGHIQSWSFLPSYFTRNVWSQVPNNETNLYRPMFLVWLRVNYMLFGGEPWGWHLTTLLMHVLATWLVYLLALGILKSNAAAILAAAVFGFHPIHVEGVAWVSGVAEPLGAVFLLLALLCYLNQRSNSSWRSPWLLLSLICFAAAVLVKETEAVLPVLILLYELTIGRTEQKGPARWPGTLLPYFVVLGLYFVLRTNAMGGALHPGTVPLHTSLISLPWLLWAYLKMLFWSAHLSPSYDFPYVADVASLRFLVPVAALLMVGGLLLWHRKTRARMGAFLAGWFLIPLTPALAAFCLAYESEGWHDRYLYLPVFALAVFAGWTLQWMLGRRNGLAQAAAIVAAVLALGGLGFATYRQAHYWQSNYELFQRATEVAPQNERAAANFVGQLINNREYRRAMELSERSIRAHPGSETPVESAATVAFLSQDFSAAERYYAQAIEMKPGDGRLFFSLGICRIRLEDYRGAADALKKAIAISPNGMRFHYSLGFALAKMGEWRAARDQFAAELKANGETELVRQALTEAEEHLKSAAARASRKEKGPARPAVPE